MKCGNTISSRKLRLLSECGNLDGGGLQKWCIGRRSFETNFVIQVSIVAVPIFDKIKTRALIGYVQWNIKFPENLVEKLPISRHFSETDTYVDKILLQLIQEYVDKEELWSQSQRMLISTFEQTDGNIITPLLIFTWRWDLYAQTFMVSLSSLLWKVLTTFCTPLSTLVVKETKIPTSVLFQRLWSCLQTGCMAIKLWNAVAIKLKFMLMMKSHMQQSTIEFSRYWDISLTIFFR